jgi:hypothetical protein
LLAALPILQPGYPFSLQDQPGCLGVGQHPEIRPFFGGSEETLRGTPAKTPIRGLLKITDPLLLGTIVILVERNTDFGRRRSDTFCNPPTP